RSASGIGRSTRADGVEPPSTLLLPRALMTGTTPNCSKTPLLTVEVMPPMLAQFDGQHPRLTWPDPVQNDLNGCPARDGGVQRPLAAQDQHLGQIHTNLDVGHADAHFRVLIHGGRV